MASVRVLAIEFLVPLLCSEAACGRGKCQENADWRSRIRIDSAAYHLPLSYYHDTSDASFYSLRGTTPWPNAKASTSLLPAPAARRATCRLALYCSTECQTKHWPSHKPSCTTADVHDLDELFENAYNDPVFNRILQALFILHFDLLRFPQVDKPIVAEIELAITDCSSHCEQERWGNGET
ncbi:hypothetical protein DFH06DRAFT_1303470 [Mycena polygramma]|nr:hypothetical protein DFH06DRAFT_1303470 [Mycena polygramma]